MRKLLLRTGQFLEAIWTTLVYTIEAIGKFARTRPMQVWAPLGVFTCSGLTFTIADDTIFEPILMVTQFVLITMQFYSIRQMTKETKVRKLKEDKERLRQFFEHAGPNGIAGSIRFLVPYKSPWFSTLYYKAKGIIRLSLYAYGNTDKIGSHTKFETDSKGFFHLQLKGCIGTEDPDKAVEGINYVAANYLTK